MFSKIFFLILPCVLIVVIKQAISWDVLRNLENWLSFSILLVDFDNFTRRGASYYIVGRISSAFLPRLVRMVGGGIRNLA